MSRLVHQRAGEGSETRSVMRARSAGASLVELLIVVAILLVILAMAVPRMMATRQSAQQVAAVALLRKLHAAQELHYIVYSQYASTFAELDGLTASLQDFSREPEFLRVRLPLRNAAVPTMAFLLLPSPQEEAFQANGPNRPRQDDRSTNGGSPPTGDPQNGGGSGPRGGGAPDSSGGGSSSPASDPESGSGGQGGNGSSSGSGGKPVPSGNGSKADRLVWHGYEFRLVRPTAHTWRCLAMPVQDEHAGNHYFVDQSGTIRREFGRPASTQSAPL